MTSAAKPLEALARIYGWMALANTDKNYGPDFPLLFQMHEIWSVESQKNYENCSHQMSDFKAKVHQIRFRLELRPRPGWWSLQRSRRPLADFKERCH